MTSTEITTREGDWMQTASGKQFWPLDPLPAEVEIVDIASALSKLCRYSGHCKQFYSVAEHSVLIARKLPAEFRLWGLLHDASEAYLCDVIRPIKPFLTNYRSLEETLMRTIADRFYLRWPIPSIVTEYDNRILHDEMAQNMAPPPAPWKLEGDPLGVTLQFWTPKEAQEEFMDTFHE